MFLAAGQHIIDKNRFAELHIPPHAERLTRATWESEPPAIYGRMAMAIRSNYSSTTPILQPHCSKLP